MQLIIPDDQTIEENIKKGKYGNDFIVTLNTKDSNGKPITDPFHPRVCERRKAFIEEVVSNKFNKKSSDFNKFVEDNMPFINVFFDNVILKYDPSFQGIACIKLNDNIMQIIEKIVKDFVEKTSRKFQGYALDNKNTKQITDDIADTFFKLKKITNSIINKYNENVEFILGSMFFVPYKNLQNNNSSTFTNEELLGILYHEFLHYYSEVFFRDTAFAFKKIADEVKNIVMYKQYKDKKDLLDKVKNTFFSVNALITNYSNIIADSIENTRILYDLRTRQGCKINLPDFSIKKEYLVEIGILPENVSDHEFLFGLIEDEDGNMIKGKTFTYESLLEKASYINKQKQQENIQESNQNSQNNSQNSDNTQDNNQNNNQTDNLDNNSKNSNTNSSGQPNQQDKSNSNQSNQSNNNTNNNRNSDYISMNSGDGQPMNDKDIDNSISDTILNTFEDVLDNIINTASDDEIDNLSDILSNALDKFGHDINDIENKIEEKEDDIKNEISEMENYTRQKYSQSRNAGAGTIKTQENMSSIYSQIVFKEQQMTNFFNAVLDKLVRLKTEIPERTFENPLRPPIGIDDLGFDYTYEKDIETQTYQEEDLDFLTADQNIFIKIPVIFDVSGSISKHDLDMFFNYTKRFINDLYDEFPQAKVAIPFINIDTELNKVSYQIYDFADMKQKDLNKQLQQQLADISGGGGTSYKSFFDAIYVEEKDRDQIFFDSIEEKTAYEEETLETLKNISLKNNANNLFQNNKEIINKYFNLFESDIFLLYTDGGVFGKFIDEKYINNPDLLDILKDKTFILSVGELNTYFDLLVNKNQFYRIDKALKKENNINYNTKAVGELHI